MRADEAQVQTTRKIFQVPHILVACFLISGATGLMYEIVWVRLLSLTFGNTVYAVGVVLTAFMSGLTLGSVLFGKWGDKKDNMLKAYGFLEIGVAVSALLSPILLKAVSAAYISTYNPSNPVWFVSVFRYFLSIAVLLIPTTLMGGTLPILSRYFVRSENELENRVGLLYSVNTIGGVLGTFLVGFLLIRHLGLAFTIFFTAALNLGIGFLSYRLGTKTQAAFERARPGPEEFKLQPGYKYVIGAFFFSGFAAMVYEVAWSRLLLNIIGSTTYAFSLILMGFLSGIALGSFIISRKFDKRRSSLLYFSIIQVSIGVVCFFTLILFQLLPSLMLYGFKVTGESFQGILVIEFLLVLLYILLPTTLFGATFPLIAGVYSSGPAHRSRSIGYIYASNTAGCIFGSLFASFLLLPYFGSSISIKAAILINLVIGFAGLMFLGKKRLAVFASVLVPMAFLPVKISPELMNTGVAIYGTDDGFSLNKGGISGLYFKEGLNATISVNSTLEGLVVLATNGKSDASNGEDMSTQLGLGYFPLLLHPGPKRVLVIGVGSGVTVKAASEFPGIEKIEVIEIEPAVIEGSRFFHKVNGGIYDDPSIRIILDDARSYLIAAKEVYDIIISEPSNPWISGIGNLFSKEYYEAASGKLGPGGIFCQWVQLYGMRPEDLKMVLGTFGSVFPKITVWYTSAGDIALLGSKGGGMDMDYLSMGRKIARSPWAWNLKAYLNISDPLDFYSYFITDESGVLDLSRDARMNTDNLPLLEFNAPYSIYTRDADRLNSSLLHKYLKIPAVSGFRGEDFDSEFLYRKTRNHLRLGIAVNYKWMKTALENHPRNRKYLLEMAKVEAQSPKRLDKARILFEEAMRTGPDDPEILFEYAAFLKRTDRERAEAYFDRAMSLGATDFRHVLEAASTKEENGKDAEALEYLMRAINLPHPQMHDSLMLYRIGLANRQLGNNQAAIEYLKRSVDSNPYNMMSKFALAETYLSVRERGAACEGYRDLLNIAPKDKKQIVKDKLTQYCGY